MTTSDNPTRSDGSTAEQPVEPAEHLDVLIIGAGISGIGAAWRLQHERPGTRYAILEARAAIGGTWDLFRYPGIRSDSDMFTLSYPFRPWRGDQSITPGDSIRNYVTDTAVEAGIDRRITFRTRVRKASWSTADAQWTVHAETTDADGEVSARVYTCRFLYSCTGYYSYDEPHRPSWPGLEDYTGTLVYPQFWPADLDHTGKRVVVIGSGATAVTIVPAMAETAERVTMLQRSPSYITAMPSRDGLADLARRRLPPRLAHRLIRAKNVAFTQFFYELSRRSPDRVRKTLRKLVVDQLKDPAYVDEHFSPRYDPWDQRMCLAPDGDFFKAIRGGRAAVVTDTIERFVPEGVRLSSGEVLEADVVVSATGLELQAFGGAELEVDGRPVDVGSAVSFRGVMLSGVPNFAFLVGYVNASWTLRADLSARYLCRLLALMDAEGYATAVPAAPPTVGRRPILDLSSGYVQRAAHRLPQQGNRAPWRVKQNYPLDLFAMSRADVREDMVFTPRSRTGAQLQGVRS